MKKLFALFLLSIVFQGAINAQRTRSEIQKMAIMLPSVDPAMTKEQRYKVVLPENISKLADDITPAAGGFFARNDMRINLASKQIGRKNVEDFDIVFEVVSSGMSRFHMTDPYKQKIAGIETYISEMYFSFPFTLLIKDRDGKLLRTVDISSGDDVFTMQYHAQFLRKLDLDTPKKPFAGFNSIKEFNESIEKIDLIKLRVAKNQLKVLFDLCSRVINTNYAGAQKKGNLVFITKLLDESPSGIYSDLLLAIETQKQALTEVYNAESQQSLVQLLKPAIATYEKYLAKEGADEKIKRLCYHNLFNCYFILVNLIRH